MDGTPVAIGSGSENEKGEANMAHEFPQLAFTQWLSTALSRIVRAIEHDPNQQNYLSRAVDFADLERRQRSMRRDHALHTFW